MGTTADGAGRCPLCTQPARPRYEGVPDRLGTTTETFDVWECTGCGSGFLHPMPSGDLGRYYPQSYLSGAGGARRFDPERWYRYDQYRFDMGLLRRAAGRPLSSFESYVDIGCGTGERVTYARQAGVDRSCGVDRFDFAKPALGRGVELVNSDVTDYRPSEPFQLASLFHVLEHVDDPLGLLRHIGEHVLVEGGWLIVQVPNYDSYERRLFGSRWFGLDVPRHLWDFSRAAVADLLTAAGFSIAGTYQRNALLHPVTIVPSLSRELDVQRIWVDRSRGTAVKRLMMVAWAAVSAMTIPISLVQNMLGRASMLTVVAYRGPEPV